MEKANTIIKDALQEILVQASEAPINSDESQTAIRYLNRMMARWSAKGVVLGYTSISNLGDDVTTPEYSYDAIIKHLASHIMQQYDVPMSASFKQELRELWRDLVLANFSIGATEYGDTLPIGSGNEDETVFDTNHFYPGLQDDILTETTGSIGLEQDTAENT